MPNDLDTDTPDPRLDALVGTVFDKRFRVEERLAAGGFGAIYRARHVKSGHEIALKVLLPELAQDLGVVARFRREGAALTALRNPHTIAAYELGQAADRTLFIVMELLHGKNLFERYRVNGPFEWKRMVKIAREVCEALAEAHALGIVHRDLKPTNIHLEQNGSDPDYVKVLDFGIAKILRGSDFDASDITNAGQMIGTLDYMSPEQMVGGVVTGQTDIYTLGIVMYEMIAGCTPFPEAMTAAAALHAMLKTTPEPLYLRAPVPEALDQIVMRCLDREAAKRYRTVSELSDALGQLLSATAGEQTRPFELGTKPTDDEATTVTPPPEKVIEVMRDLGVARRKQTPAAEWTDDDEHLPTSTRRPDHAGEAKTTHRPDSKPQHRPANVPESKTTHRPSSEGATTHRPAPDSKTTRRPESHEDATQPAPRPLPRRDTPIPQLVAAPFSGKRTPSVPPAPPPAAFGPERPPPFGSTHPPVQATPLPNQLGSHLPGMMRGPSSPNLPYSQYPPTPVPYVPPQPLLAEPLGEPARRQAYDMGQLTAREAAIRRLVWIIVLVVGAIVGIAIATFL